MSTEKPLFVVLGATGKQGGSIITHFLSQSPPPYKLRALTRDPSSANAVALASQGVEVVKGDFDEPQSLDAAFFGASTIFSVTDFDQLMKIPSLRDNAIAAGESIGFYIRDYEAQQNKNIIDAAAKVNTLERFIYSGTPNMNELSGGKYAHVYHCDSKAIAEKYGQATYPKLWAKTSVLYASFFLENFFQEAGRIFCPRLNKAKDTIIASSVEPLTSTILPWYSVIDDTGTLVAALLKAPAGKKLLGVSEWMNLQEIYKLIAEALGKKIEFVDSAPSYDLGDAEMQRGRQEMMGFTVEFGFGEDKDTSKPEELGIPLQLESVKEWVGKQDWEKVLLVEE